MEQIKNIIRDPATGYDEVLKLEDMIQNSPRYTDDQRRLFFRLIDKEKARVYVTENATAKQLRMIENDPEGFEVLLEQMVKDGFGESFNQGGRVGMFAGGKLIGKGIMEAAKLAKRGMKPFGEKQTYKQKVTMKGVSDDQFDEIFEKQLARVPDEVSDQATADGLNQSLREAEAIITGQKLGLLSQPQRTKIATAITKKVRDQIYGDNARFSNDYLEYMDDAVARVEDILQIEKLGGDITPKPIFDGSEIIGAQVDFSQLPKLLKKESTYKDTVKSIDTVEDKINDLINKLADDKSGELSKNRNVIPFKPKTKKAEGGRIGFKDGDKVDTLFEPKYDSATGNYDVAGGVDIGPFDMNVRGSGNIDMNDPTMAYEAGLNLPNDFRIEGGYYDDAVMQPGMMSPEDELRLRIIKSFANGGTVPPQKGPMSQGMGTLYRRK